MKPAGKEDGEGEVEAEVEVRDGLGLGERAGHTIWK